MRRVCRPEAGENHKGSMFKHLAEFEWKHHNLVLLFVSILVAVYILMYKPIAPLVNNLDNMGYIAAFIYGMMYTYAITTAPASALIFNLGSILNPLFIALIGAFGSVLGDYLIFRFVRDKLMDEIILLKKEINGFVHPAGNHSKAIKIGIWKRISASKVWKAIVPVIAGLIIASPLPDELGVAIFGAIKFEPKKFLVVAYLLNFVGILAIAYLGSM